MLNLWIRRIVIFTGLCAILVGATMSYGESLLLTAPEELDVIQALLQKREQQEILRAEIEAEIARLEQLEEEAREQREQELLEEQQRLEEEAQALIDAYTLGNRDKPQDYQNLFDNSIKHTFIVDFDTAEWEGLIQDMEDYHDLYGTYRSNNYRKVDVTYITDDETLSIKDVGIRSKGNIYSRYPPVNSQGDVIPIHYVLKFNETFDTQVGTEEYTLLKTREVFDLEKLIFKHNRNNDATYLSEVYSMQVFRDAGVAAPMMSLANYIIRIDGEVVFEELYGVQEYIDEEFVRKQLQDVPTKEVGDLYKVIWPGTLEPIYNTSLIGIREWETNTRPVYGLESNDDIMNYQQLIDFTFALDNSNETERKAFIEESINVDNMIRAFAVSIFLGNPDDYRGNANNYYLYFDQQGVFTYIPFDFDHSLGQGWPGNPVFIDYSLGNDIYTWEGDGFSAATRNIPLIDNILLTYDEYQILYEDYLEAFISDGTFSYTGFSALFNQAQALYGDQYYMVNDKEYYITTKITNVLEDIEQYRNIRKFHS